MAFRLRINEAATVAVTFTQGKGKHLKKVGTFAFTRAAGADTVYFDGKIAKGTTLKPGKAAVSIAAVNTVGLASPKVLHFRTH